MKTIDQIRLARLRELVSNHGTQAALARVLGKDPNQINQWLGKGKAQPMSGKSARGIEQKLRLPDGWMDTDPDGEKVSPTSQSVGLEPLILSEALKWLDFDETQGGQYPHLERAQRLMEIYRALSAHGGQIPPELADRFIEAAKARRTAGGGNGEHDAGTGRVGARGRG